MRLSNICVALMAMASSVYSQSEGCEDFDPSDIQPGHLGGISKLPHEIQRCIKLSIPLAFVNYEQQLDLFCDHSTGSWHQEIPTCLKQRCSSDPSAAIANYNTFNSALCRGWEAPGLPLTTILSIDGVATTSTIYPTTSETRYILPEFTPRHSTTTSHACIWGIKNCYASRPTSMFSWRTKSSKWRKPSHRLMATTTPWGEKTRPVSTHAVPT